MSLSYRNVSEIRRAMPNHVFERSTLLGTMYALRDALMAFTAIAFLYFMDQLWIRADAAASTSSILRVGVQLANMIALGV